MSYQFIHYENYSINISKKKAKENKSKRENYNNETTGRNLREVIAEAKREPGNFRHVDHAEEPILLYGVELDEVERLALEYHSKTKIKVNVKGEEKERGLRKDANIILAGIVSLAAENIDFWEDYKNDAMKYLKNKYGDKLKSVVEHTDEDNPHFHYYVIQNQGEIFDLVHDGKRAMLENKDKIKSDQNKAYKKAMREFQKDFWLNVSSKYGLMKDGPKLTRKTHAQYEAEKRQVRLINELKTKTEIEINILKEKTKKEIQRQKTKTDLEINSIKEKARADAFSFAIKEFNNKSTFNKIIFSIAYNKNKAKSYDNIKSKNEFLIKKADFIDNRKNIYKEKYNVEFNNNKSLYHENKKLKEITEFLNFDLNNENTEEKNENVRRAIIGEIEAIENQQQQIDSGIEKNNRRNLFNKSTIRDIKDRANRFRRVLLINFREFVRDIFSIDTFSRKFEEEKSEKINKINYKEETRAEEFRRNEPERTKLRI